MLKNKAFGVSLPINILEEIDKDRKDISRSRYLLRILERSYVKQKVKMDSPESGFEALETGESIH